MPSLPMFFRIVLLAIAALTLASCRENPARPSPLRPQPPMNFAVVGISETTVRANWSAPANAEGVTGYLLRWKGSMRGDSSLRQLSAAATSADIGGLRNDQSYTFRIYTLRGATPSEPATFVWSWNGDKPATPRNLTASSLSATSVKLRWDPVPASTGYRVAWRGATAADSGSAAAGTATEHTVNGLAVGVPYTFTVFAISGAAESDPASIRWAGATWYVNDQGNPSTTIRLYEASSTMGSAITIDPALGGPKNVLTISGTPGRAQLSIWVDADMVIIGPSYAIVEIKSSDDLAKTDSSVYISETAYQVTGFDTWLSTGSLDGFFRDGGNVSAFNLPAAGAGPYGFFVRTGTSGNYHYARVLVKAGAGGILQGARPNRYVELEISYQTVANVPFAKPIG